MTFTVDGINDTFRGIADLVFTDKSTGELLVMPKPATFSIQENPIQRRLPTTDSAGYSTFQGAFKKGYDWQMLLSYANLQPEILQFRLARKFKNVSNKVSTFQRTIYVYANQIPGAATADVAGHSITADNTAAKASVKEGNFSTPLERVPFASLDPEDDTMSFAIGANFALKFSNDLIDKTVAVSCPYTIPAAVTLGSEVLPRYEVNATLVTTSNEAVLVRVFDASVNVEGAGVSPDEEQVSLPFFINMVPGKGLPFDWDYTGKSIILN